MALEGSAFERLKRLGSFATNLVHDETFRDIMRMLKDDCIRNWADSQHLDKREAYWLDLQALGRFEKHLVSIGEEYRAEVRKHEILARQQAMRHQRELRG